MKAVLNGRLVATAALPPEPPAAAGVFETLPISAAGPAALEPHLARYAGGCAHFGLAGAPAAAEIARWAAILPQLNGLRQGVLRWACWRVAGGCEWTLRADPPRPHTLKPAWSARVSPRRLGPPGPESAFKHLGRRSWLDALAEARAGGADEAILADGEGRVVEGAISNVFCVHRGRLRTPPLDCGPLPGIARARVLALAAAAGSAAAERAVSLEELASADEVFLTNALIGIRPVVRLDGRELPAPGPVAARLMEAWGRP